MTSDGGADTRTNASPDAACSFPAGFGWGVATAAYQNEGSVAEGGRSISIWDTFARGPGNIADGTTGDVACDHYHRYEQDVALISQLGVGYYRFSLAWPRLQPDGRGALHQSGLDFYKRLTDSLLEHGIEPWVTLYHWDLPQVLEDAGGWPERDTALRFADYASRVYEHLHDRVKFWTTLNEPSGVSFSGYAEGRHAPGARNDAAALRAAHHLLLAHGLATNAMRAQNDPRSQFGITLILKPVVPVSQEEADRDAARRIDLIANRVWLDPIFRGRYPNDFLDHTAAITDPGYIRGDDSGIIAAPLDVLGVNYYFRLAVRHGTSSSAPSPWVGCHGAEVVPGALPKTAMGWEIDADGLYEVLSRVARDYTAIPLYVTENGAAFPDQSPTDGRLCDSDRIAYLDAHFRAAHRAIADGVDLRGYFVWTLMDNWEWAHGYTKKFGLYHVDFATQRRTPKDSARWFANVTKRNGLPAKFPS